MQYDRRRSELPRCRRAGARPGPSGSAVELTAVLTRRLERSRRERIARRPGWATGGIPSRRCARHGLRAARPARVRGRADRGHGVDCAVRSEPPRAGRPAAAPAGRLDPESSLRQGGARPV
jgi:hypothetical protein